MDDKTFDDIIKKKADGFNDTGHDAHALTDLRERLSHLPSKKNSWNGGKTAYVVGSMILFSLINFGIVWYFNEGRNEALNSEIDQLRSERNQFVFLQEELTELKYLQTDTVYIYRDLLTAHNIGQPKLTYRIDNQEDKGHLNNENFANSQANSGSFYALLAENQGLSEELKTLLTRNNLLLKGEHGEMILIVHNQSVTPVSDFALTRSQGITAPGMPKYLPEVATYEQTEPRRKPEKKKIPNKMLWAMEKHNHKGLDFQFGVEGMLHKSNYDIGTGDINGGVGFMTEIMFSPVLRLETGVQFAGRSYRIKEDEVQTLPPEFFDDYPGYDDQLGELISLESDAQLVKIPLNLKVFGILDHNKKWYVSAGLTPQWAVKQEMDYKYALDVPSPPIGGAEFVSFVGSKELVSSAFYTTTLNLGVGTEVYLNERLRWQLGLFYQKGLSDAGVENRKLTSSFGVKSSIWFNRP